MENSGKENWMVVKYFVKLSTWLSMTRDEAEAAAANGPSILGSASPRDQVVTQALRASQKRFGSTTELSLVEEDWEWVRSPKEEYAIKISLENALRIERELQELKKTQSSIKLRKYFFKKCSEFMNLSLAAEERAILSTSLDAPKRSAIIKAAIKQLEQTWLEFIRQQFFIRHLPSSSSSAAAIRVSSSFSSHSLSSLSTRSSSSSSLSSTNSSSSFSTTSSTSSTSSSPLSTLGSSSSTRLGTSPLSEAMILSTSPAIFSDSDTTPSSSPPSWPPEMPLRSPSPSSLASSASLSHLKVSGTWEIFANSYQEQAYEKNIAGSMASVGFQASHGAQGDLGLTPRILGDIVWSVFSTLTHAICQTLQRDFLEKEEMKLLAKKVLLLQQPLIQLWLQTIKVSRTGTKNEGKIVSRWKLEEEKEKQRLLELKRQGQVDAKWFDEDRRKKLFIMKTKRRLRGEEDQEGDQEVAQDFEDGIFLSNFEPTSPSVQGRENSGGPGLVIIEDYQPHPGREDFLKAKKLLEATLFGRFSSTPPSSSRKKRVVASLAGRRATPTITLPSFPPLPPVPSFSSTSNTALPLPTPLTPPLPRLRVKIELNSNSSLMTTSTSFLPAPFPSSNSSASPVRMSTPVSLEEVPLDDPAEEEGFENVHILEFGEEEEQHEEVQENSTNQETQEELLLDLELEEEEEIQEQETSHPPNLSFTAQVRLIPSALEDSLIFDYRPVRQSSIELERQLLYPLIAASDKPTASSTAF